MTQNAVYGTTAVGAAWLRQAQGLVPLRGGSEVRAGDLVRVDVPGGAVGVFRSAAVGRGLVEVEWR